jgi:hypothetical protein
MSYPLVHISNSTNFPAAGQVTYATFLCSDDSYTIDPRGQWTAGSRGVCLVTEVSARLNVNGQWINASPYTSSGTSYSQFAIIETGNNTFAVTRVTDLVDSVDVGELLPEPTEMQK